MTLSQIMLDCKYSCSFAITYVEVDAGKTSDTHGQMFTAFISCLFSSIFFGGGGVGDDCKHKHNFIEF